MKSGSRRRARALSTATGRCGSPAGGLPDTGYAVRSRAHDDSQTRPEDKDDNDGCEDGRAVENGAVNRYQIADAAGGIEHFGHDDADDSQGAAGPRPPGRRAQSGSRPG